MYKLITALFAVTYAMPSYAAEEKPLWELGIGAAGLSIPDYRGSARRQNYLLPVPYFVYRGEKIKMDRDGLRGLLYQSERVKLDISLDGSVPVQSDDNAVRRGMPDLNPVFEIGPSLKVSLLKNGPGRTSLNLIFPLRAAISIDSLKPSYEGWLFHPQFGLSLKATEELGFGFSIGPLYANLDYHAYYYSVEEQYAIPERPVYTAKAGYSGTRLGLSAKWQWRHLQLGAFVRYDNLDGSAFEDSPLVEQDYSIMTGFALVWSLKQSRRMVSSKPFEF